MAEKLNKWEKVVQCFCSARVWNNNEGEVELEVIVVLSTEIRVGQVDEPRS